MTKGISLHVGLNFVDPVHYDGWDGELAACEFDAKDMVALAEARGFKSAILLREKATARAVKTAIDHERPHRHGTQGAMMSIL